jgi:hypothetical protein
VLAGQRKPFVVTADYIGPDRRKDPDRGSEIPLIDVPNTLKAKAEGKPIMMNDLDAMIGKARQQIDDQKLKRNAFQISFLVGLVLPLLEQGILNDESKAYLTRLMNVSDDVQERLATTSFTAARELSTTLIDVVQSMVLRGGALDPKNIKLLKPLSDGIMAGFNPGRAADDMASEITDSIRKFQSRRR